MLNSIINTRFINKNEVVFIAQRIILISLVLMFISTIPVYSKEHKFTFKSSENYFALNPVTDSVLLGTGLALAGTSIIINKVAPVKNNTWNGELYNINDVWTLDRLFMNKYSKTSHIISTALEATALLYPAILISTPIEEWCTIGTMYAESVILSYGLKEIGKTFVFRPRPYMYFQDYPQDEVESGDWNCSFPSGHTTMSFTAAAFTTFAFCEYFPNSAWKIPAIIGSYAIATTTAVLRLSGGNHFLTDVLAGAVIGSISGFVVPYLHTFGTSISTDKVEVSVAPTSFVIKLKL